MLPPQIDMGLITIKKEQGLRLAWLARSSKGKKFSIQLKLFSDPIVLITEAKAAIPNQPIPIGYSKPAFPQEPDIGRQFAPRLSAFFCLKFG